MSLLQTPRLLLRQWRDEDIEAFAAMNQCREVMKYFPRHYTDEESRAFVEHNVRHIEQHGWGNWAVEVAGGASFIGFVGLSKPALWHPCAGSVEIGWRLDQRFWHNGYATEAARQVLTYGFEVIKLPEIISFTAVHNKPSIAVMNRLGMHCNGEYFDHPRIDTNNPLCKHVVYRLAQAQ